MKIYDDYKTVVINRILAHLTQTKHIHEKSFSFVFKSKILE